MLSLKFAPIGDEFKWIIVSELYPHKLYLMQPSDHSFGWSANIDNAKRLSFKDAAFVRAILTRLDITYRATLETEGE